MNLIKKSFAVMATLSCISTAQAAVMPSYHLVMGGLAQVNVQFIGQESNNVWVWQLNSIAYNFEPSWDKSAFTFFTGTTANPLFGLNLVSSSVSSGLSILDDPDPTKHDGNLSYFIRLGDGTAQGSVVATLDDTPPTNPMPEPASLALLGFGLTGLAWLRRRRA